MQCAPFFYGKSRDDGLLSFPCFPPKYDFRISIWGFTFDPFDVRTTTPF